jgi:hypothetical protein
VYRERINRIREGEGIPRAAFGGGGGGDGDESTDRGRRGVWLVKGEKQRIWCSRRELENGDWGIGEVGPILYLRIRRSREQYVIM